MALSGSWSEQTWPPTASCSDQPSASADLVGKWEVSTAASGHDGIVGARAQKPDAILLDVMMPDMDGPTTLERLRADPETSDIPLVFLTAKTQAADRSRLANLGAAGILTKPFDPLTLPSQIAAVLRRE